MDEKRANFTICCLYPSFVIVREDFEVCKTECNQKFENIEDSYDLYCCINLCALLRLNVMIEDKKNPGRFQLNLEGFIKSFMMSIENNSKWLPTVTKSSKRCFDDFYEPHHENTQDIYCDGIPSSFYEIINCCYIENFLRSPVFNPKSLKECEFTLRYVDECLRSEQDSKDLINEIWCRCFGWFHLKIFLRILGSYGRPTLIHHATQKSLYMSNFNSFSEEITFLFLYVKEFIFLYSSIESNNLLFQFFCNHQYLRLKNLKIKSKYTNNYFVI